MRLQIPHHLTQQLPASYGLLLARTTPIPENFILTHLPNDIRQRLLQQTPTIIRTNTTPPKPARDTCSIYNFVFAGLTPTKCLRYLRAATLHTLNKLLTADEYRQPHDTTTMAARLSPPTQALLQAIYSIQPATAWSTAAQASTITFTPTEVDYNPLRLHAQPYTLMLTHPPTLSYRNSTRSAPQDSGPMPRETTHG